MRGFGSYPLPKGCWSDDTSLSLAALDNLADGELDYFDIMVNFAKWLKKGEYTPMGICFDVGRTCKRTIQHFFDLCYTEENGFLLPPGLDLAWIGETEEASNGNGSLMRIHPFVLMAYYDKRDSRELEETVDRASSLTHAHERSLLACRIYARVLWGLLENPDKATVFAILKEVAEEYRNHPESIHFRRILDGTLPTLKSEAIRSHGYVVDTLEAALWCLLTTESYHDCVLKAVNLGHDTDTVAAVAGGLAGALYGYRNIPTGWLENLKRREYIESMCERAYIAWQG
jgi:ADP-ribosylglycohydrolase